MKNVFAIIREKREERRKLNAIAGIAAYKQNTADAQSRYQDLLFSGVGEYEAKKQAGFPEAALLLKGKFDVLHKRDFVRELKRIIDEPINERLISLCEWGWLYEGYVFDLETRRLYFNPKMRSSNSYYFRHWRSSPSAYAPSLGCAYYCYLTINNETKELSEAVFKYSYRYQDDETTARTRTGRSLQTLTWNGVLRNLNAIGAEIGYISKRVEKNEALLEKCKLEKEAENLRIEKEISRLAKAIDEKGISEKEKMLF
ncbi:MAG: hypothetical protein LBR70_03560 [Lactobacillaceae bacterium]|jgi:hypothetical protein|nr:hypothetical protein [Lactobacillaceae bacterium]